jgi:hypothetical protein
MITHARPLTFGTYLSDSLQPGLGPVDPTSHSASHSGPGPLADTMVRVPHGSWRDGAARVVLSSLMSTEVSPYLDIVVYITVKHLQNTLHNFIIVNNIHGSKFR